MALALGHKGIEADWIDVDPRDRSDVERVSGQSLVPVLVDGDRVITDSTTIIRFLEREHPAPALWPRPQARRAEVDVFVDWFNRVWKVPPNAIDAERRKPSPDDERIEAWGAELRDSLDVFEALLDGRDYLFGEFSVADCIGFPFLRYALGVEPEDDEPFHHILREFMPLDDTHSRLEAWIRRVEARPRA